MRSLPLTDPGVPDLRSANRFLIWVGRGQLSTLLGGMVFGVTWMVAMALTPAAIGAAIDAGVRAHDTHALLVWLGVITALVLVQAGSGLVRHRFALSNWMIAAFRCAQLLGEHVAAAAQEVTAEVPPGDVGNTLGSDAIRVGAAFDVSARFMGSIVSYLVVAGIMLYYSIPLGLTVLVGVPVLLAAVTPLIRPLQMRQRAVRDATGRLSAFGADTVAGLRILRGVGGEAVYLSRYRDRSGEVMRTGQATAEPQALLDAAQVALPAVFILAITWLGANLALDHRITLGQLVAFYGFSVFLVAPLTVTTEFLQGLTRAQVGAARLIRILAIDAPHPGGEIPGPGRGAGLADPESLVAITGGALTVLVSADPDYAIKVAERLGGLVPSDATFGGVPVRDLTRDERRRRIVVSESDPRLFSGPLVGELAVGRSTTTGDGAAGVITASQPTAGRNVHEGGRSVDTGALMAALEVASAADIIDALPDGLDAELEERGRSLSGGQRQRLTLARALLTGAEVLILIEPTSAVDAHSERRIAERLARYRSGQTTVIVSSSPLVLDLADEVVFLDDGEVPLVGTHASLLATEPSYRDTVLRGEAS